MAKFTLFQVIELFRRKEDGFMNEIRSETMVASEGSLDVIGKVPVM